MKALIVMAACMIFFSCEEEKRNNRSDEIHNTNTTSGASPLQRGFDEDTLSDRGKNK